MATTLQQVKGYLDEKGFKYSIDEKKQLIRTGFNMDHYVDSDGDKSVRIVVRLYEDGEFIEVLAPNLYTYKDGPNALALLQACLIASWRTKMVQFEYDPSDGEIRATIEVPIEDSTMTSRQFHRILGGLLTFVDKFHPMLKEAMDTGKIVPPDDEDRRMTEVMEMLRRLGPEGLKKVLDAAGQAADGAPAAESAAGSGEPPAKL